MEDKQKKQIKRLKILVAFLLLIILLMTAFILHTLYKDSRDNERGAKVKNAPALNAQPQKTAEDEKPEKEEIPADKPEKAEPTPERQSDRRGTAEPIPEDIRKTMEGLSMRSNPDISYDDLSYLTIPHYDFYGSTAVGHMVVNRAVAEEVLDIFAELYDIKYPIERMELIDKYGADDYVSIDNNNTSAFNYRVSTDGSGRLSKHALGRAVDINPQINPYVNSNGAGAHENAREYWSRDYDSWHSDVAKAAYIGPGTQIYTIFVEEHGWEWGGSWPDYRDYQHFQKND